MLIVCYIFNMAHYFLQSILHADKISVFGAVFGRPKMA
jgi:hypothetical protein